MSATKRRSKKRSVANSKQPPDPRVLYLDRNLGKHVIASALQAAGHSVEVHDDHLPGDAPDEQWIKLVGDRGWIALTKDKNIRYRHAEFEAIREHGARVVVIRAKNLVGQDLANLVVKYHERIQKFASINESPFVAGLDRTGILKLCDFN